MHEYERSKEAFEKLKDRYRKDYETIKNLTNTVNKLNDQLEKAVKVCLFVFIW